MVELRRLRLLVELHRRGSIAQVAQALHLSPSGVSHQLSLLEREVGTALLERVGRGVRLTEAGEHFAGRGRDILISLEAAESELHSRDRDTSGTVRLAAFQSTALMLVPQALACQGKHPRLRIELAQAEPEIAVPALLAGDFDVVVSEEYPGMSAPAQSDIHREVLCSDDLDFVLSHELADTRSVAGLGAELPWVMEPPGSVSRSWAEQLCRTWGFQPDVRYESEDLLVHRELIMQQHAIGILPRLMTHTAQSRLLRQPTGQARTLISLAKKGRHQLPAVCVVRSALKQAATEYSASEVPNTP